jgi:phosphatidylethanolamine/phosphatidyl-N-methylethanolamine N-methyltransferase
MSDIRQKDVTDTYRRYAPFYNAIFGPSLEHGRRMMATRVSSMAPNTILEVGIGTGLTLGLYPGKSSVTGIDISKQMLAKAQRRAAQLPNNSIILKEMDAEKLSFPDNSFDVVTAPYVLSVTPNPAIAVAEMRRVCRSGGHIVIVNHFSGSSGWRFMERFVKPLAKYIGFRSDFDFHTHVGAFNWKIESIESVNTFSLSKLVIIRNE